VRRLVGNAAATELTTSPSLLRPETKGVVQRFNRSLRYEHPCQREIEQAAELASIFHEGSHNLL
jgi:hypothetical protein